MTGRDGAPRPARGRTRATTCRRRSRSRSPFAETFRSFVTAIHRSRRGNRAVIRTGHPSTSGTITGQLALPRTGSPERLRQGLAGPPAEGALHRRPGLANGKAGHPFRLLDCRSRPMSLPADPRKPVRRSIPGAVRGHGHTGVTIPYAPAGRGRWVLRPSKSQSALC
jgi:hypothetical protein